MAFTFSILFISVLYRYLFIHEVLSIHIGYSFIRGLKIRKGYKAVTFRKVGFIPGNLCHR